MCRRTEPSVLRKRDYNGLSNTAWMDEVIEEIKRRSPMELWKILCAMMDYNLNPTKKLAPICMLYGMIMFENCDELTRIQRINTVLLMQGQATTQVTTFVYCLIFKIRTVFALFQLEKLSYRVNPLRCKGTCGK